jgi:hypothetical protein
MTISTEFINQIVRNVMREMQSRVSTVDAAVPVVVNLVKEAEVLSLGPRVISENVLVEANAAGRTISLQAGAVITPSGRDYIRRHHVRVSSQVGGRSTPAVSGIFIAVGTHATLQSAASAAGWKTLTATSEFAAAALASDNLKNGIVACGGGEPSVVACLLNRNTSVRAAVVTRTTNLVTLTTAMNPQVLCLDSSGWSFGELLRLLRGLAAAVVVPKDWKEIPAGGTR